MNDREKLVALITEALHRKEGEARVVGDYYTNRIADYLIANGVTVSPIPVGSTVYALYAHYETKWGYSQETRRYNHQIVTGKNLKMAKMHNVEVREKKANKQDILLLGRLVFLTREEAEQALQEED